jgi:hypothetical protein
VPPFPSGNGGTSAAIALAIAPCCDLRASRACKRGAKYRNFAAKEKNKKINCAGAKRPAHLTIAKTVRERILGQSPKMRTSLFAKSIFFAYSFCRDKKSKIKEKVRPKEKPQKKEKPQRNQYH